MHFLCHYVSDLVLGLESELELELPYRVAKAELLVGVAEDAACYMR